MQLDDVLASLDLEQTGPSSFSTGGLHFPTVTWTFGGLLVAQVMMAAVGTAPDRSVRSCHVTFLSRSDPHRPIIFDVNRVDDRTTFAHRVVTGRQDGDARVIANVLLHQEEPDGPRHQTPTIGDFRVNDAAPSPRSFVLETRDASEPRLFSTTDACDSDIAVWFRVPELHGPRQLHESPGSTSRSVSTIGSCSGPSPTRPRSAAPCASAIGSIRPDASLPRAPRRA